MTSTIKRVVCSNCGHTYKVYYKEKRGREWVWRSRIIDIISGSREELMKMFYKIRGVK